MGKKLPLDNKKIKELYIDKRISTRKIAKFLNCSDTHIINCLKRMEIPRRNNSESQIGVKRSPMTLEQKKARSERVKQDYIRIPDLRKKRSISSKRARELERKSGRNKIIAKKISKTRIEKFKKGEIKIWNKGLTKDNNEGMKKISKSRKGKKRPDLSKRNNTSEYQKKCALGQLKKPTKPERIMINLIKQNNLPFNYIGDGNIWIGGFNPDFLSKNPKHIIEIFGDYWHNLPKIKERDRRRLETYSKYGYKTLVIWEHELKNQSQVLNKIRKFLI